MFPIIKVPKPYNGFVTNNFGGMCLSFQWNLVNAMTAIRKEDQFASHLVDRYRPSPFVGETWVSLKMDITKGLEKMMT